MNAADHSSRGPKNSLHLRGHPHMHAETHSSSAMRAASALFCSTRSSIFASRDRTSLFRLSASSESIPSGGIPSLNQTAPTRSMPHFRRGLHRSPCGRTAFPDNKSPREMEVKKKIIPLLASAMIAATLATASDSWAEQQRTSATDPMSAGGPPAPNSPPTYVRPGISGSPIPSNLQNGSITKQLGGSSKPATVPITLAPRLPPVQAFE
jgi:hypothetical protein